MGFVKQGNGDGKKTYFVKIKGLESTEKEVYFETTTKDEDGKWIVSDTREYAIEGHLVDIKLDQYNLSDGTPRDVYKLTFEDNKERIVVSSALTNLGRGIINSLLNITKFGVVKLFLYTMGKDDGKVSKGATVYNNGEKIGWKHDREELKAMIDPITDKRGQLVKNDYSELDVFFKEKIVKELQPAIAGSDSMLDEIIGTTEAPKSEPTISGFKEKIIKTAEERVKEHEDQEDLPF